MNNAAEKLLAQMALPAIAAPMFLVSSKEMVVESCKAGIMGSFPLANARTLEDLDEWMSFVKENVLTAKGESAGKVAPWAVNIAVHRTNNRYEDEVKFIEKYEPPVVITSLGDPSRVVDVVHNYGGLVFSDVINLKHARKAAGGGIDGLILVCSGAGGHAGGHNPFGFLNAVKEFWNGITILAGGISTGRDVLAAKVMGADFAYMGTRFIASRESLANSDYQRILIESNLEDIIYTDVFSGVKANYLVKSLEHVGIDPKQLPTKADFDWSKTSGKGIKAWKDIWSAGHGVGAIKRDESVAEIVKDLKKEYAEANAGMSLQKN